MTLKQKRFADEYIKSGNATQSYLKAYGSCTKQNTAEVSSCRLLKNDKVYNYINEVMKNKDKQTIASQDEVLEYYTRVMRAEEKDFVLVQDITGETIEKDVTPTLKERTKAADALAKRYGINVCADVGSDGDVSIVIKPREGR